MMGSRGDKGVQKSTTKALQYIPFSCHCWANSDGLVFFSQNINNTKGLRSCFLINVDMT